MYIYVYIYIYTFTHKHTYGNIHMHTYILTHKIICMHIRINAETYVHKLRHAYTCISPYPYRHTRLHRGSYWCVQQGMYIEFPQTCVHAQFTHARTNPVPVLVLYSQSSKYLIACPSNIHYICHQRMDHAWRQDRIDWITSHVNNLTCVHANTKMHHKIVSTHHEERTPACGTERLSQISLVQTRVVASCRRVPHSKNSMSEFGQ